MKLYIFLSRFSLLKKYTAKFMLVAFLGIHIPLFGVIGALVLSSGSTVSKGGIFLLTLGLTLLATTITLFILNGLVSPLTNTQRSLTNYLNTRTLPNLPLDMTDEMGVLMRDVNVVITNMDAGTEEKSRIIHSLSHGLRQPANNALALINSVKNETDPDKIARQLDDIQHSINQQLKLMDEMLDKYGR